MQPNKTKIALLLGAVCLGASGAANAATANFDVTVTTIPDVTLSEERPLDYGTSVFTAANGTCLMNARQPGNDNSVAASLGTNMQYQTDTNLIDPANYGDLSGTGCVGGSGTGTPGLYKITGIAGQAVKITIGNATAPEFSFTPNSGCIVTYGATDSCAAFTPGALNNKTLAASAGEAPSNPVGDAAVSGELVFTVGGTITIGGTDLAPNQSYSADFPVTVVY